MPNWYAPILLYSPLTCSNHRGIVPFVGLKRVNKWQLIDLIRFKSNPVAIVKLSDVNLSQEQKQLIAKDPNFFDTVFLYLVAGDRNHHVDIFSRANEM